MPPAATALRATTTGLVGVLTLHLVLALTRGASTFAESGRPHWIGLALYLVSLAFLLATFRLAQGERSADGRGEPSAALAPLLLAFTAIPLLRDPLMYGGRPGAVAAMQGFLVCGFFAVALRMCTGGGRREWWILAAGSLVAARVVAVIASPLPYIDVWYFFQEASDALAAGENPYAASYSNIYGQNIFGYEPFFGYPPASLLSLAGFRWLLGDVRFGLVAAEVVAAGLFHLCLRWRGATPDRARLWTIALLSCSTSLFILEFSWLEPLMLLYLVATVVALDRGRPALAGAMGALLLCTKQSAILLLLPIALFGAAGRARVRALIGGAVVALSLLAPFFIWDAGALVGGLSEHLQIPPRADALNLGAMVAHLTDFRPPPAIAWPLWLCALGLWWQRGERDLAAALIVSSIASAIFFTFARQAFCNYYYLVGCTLVVGLALRANPPAAASEGE